MPVLAEIDRPHALIFRDLFRLALGQEPPGDQHRDAGGEGEDEIQEYRINGKLYMQRVTPKIGKPYVLMDSRGDGSFTRLDNSLTPNVRVPQWVLHTF